MDSGYEGWRRGAAILLGIAVVAAAGVGIAVAVHGQTLLGVGYAVLGWSAVATVLLAARRFPGPGVVITGLLATTAFVLVPGPPVALLPFAVAIARAMTADARVWAVATVAGAYLAPLVLLFATDSPVTAVRGFGAMVILLVALGVGTFLRSRTVRVAEEARRREEVQRIAVEQERVRIARDLHDVLAHSLSSISVQAGVGLHLAAERPAAATEALETIRGVSGEALDEVRAVLGVLRGDDAAPTSPGPDLDAVTVLAADARRTGARIEVRDELQPRPPRAVQVALYRIVQEALTNARRHASGATVEVTLAREAGAVVARIRDRAPLARPAAPVAGNGITGMTERAASLGGTLTLEPRDDGIEVVARIPEAP